MPRVMPWAACEEGVDAGPPVSPMKRARGFDDPEQQGLRADAGDGANANDDAEDDPNSDFFHEPAFEEEYPFGFMDYPPESFGLEAVAEQADRVEMTDLFGDYTEDEGCFPDAMDHGGTPCGDEYSLGNAFAPGSCVHVDSFPNCITIEGEGIFGRGCTTPTTTVGTSGGGPPARVSVETVLEDRDILLAGSFATGSPRLVDTTTILSV